ncbi:hypothetical protein KKA85_01840, partial [bacterium]|nr:hypothetical protein [bacterium]MBU1674502.1 hypothetical protein [bacterium]
MRFAVALLALILYAPAARCGWWEGFAAPPAGQGVDDVVRVLHVHDGDLFAGGSFNDAGGVAARYVARWDSTAWHDLDTGTNNRVDALCSHKDELIAGGRFTEAGGVTVEYVASWDGQQWSPVGLPAAWTWGYVLSLAEHDGDLYAGGSGYVARWDGLAWSAVTGAGFAGDVFALVSCGGALYAGGAFASITNPGGGAVAAANLACWEGVAWAPVGSGTNGTVYALSPHGDDLVAGGVFSSPGHLVAGWTGAAWYAPGGGLDGAFVIALDEWSGRLVAGGDITGSGGTLMNRIGLLDGGGWGPLGDGVNDMVRAVAGLGGAVFAGGAFGYAGGLPSRHVGRWDDPSVGAGDAPPVAGMVNLLPPFPNPGNPRVTIPVRIDAPARVKVAIYDLHGRMIRCLWDDVSTTGTIDLVWDGDIGGGGTAPSGSYLARAVTRAGSSAALISLVK